MATTQQPHKFTIGGTTIEALLPPGADDFVITNTCGRGPAFRLPHTHDNLAMIHFFLAEFESWPIVTQKGFARIMESLWEQDARRKGTPSRSPEGLIWTEIIQAVEAIEAETKRRGT